MMEKNEYSRELEYLYSKSLVLESVSEFHPVLWFHWVDAIAHIDYTLSVSGYSFESPRSIMAGEYMRWRIDEEKKGDRVKFPAFVNWLKETHPDRFEALPLLWRRIYDSDDRASYRSFRIVFDPDSREPIRSHVFYAMIEEFFKSEFLKSLYDDASLANLFREFQGPA